MKENQLKRDSILSMAQGAIEEKVDYEVSRVIDNILDLNTDPKAKRKITSRWYSSRTQSASTLLFQQKQSPALLPRQPWLRP